MVSLIHDWHSVPVTGLALADGGRLLLVGSGSRLRAYCESGQGEGSGGDEESVAAVLADDVKVFESQPIHGFVQLDPLPRDGALVFAAWGGNSIRILSLQLDKTDGEAFAFLSPELVVVDRIVSACQAKQPGSSQDELAILTAHNEVHSLRDSAFSPAARAAGRGWQNPVRERVAGGRPLMLYSGHLVALAADGGGGSSTLVVASGTMFGQVLVWTCETTIAASGARAVACSTLAEFHEHSGSVFGTRILDAPFVRSGTGARTYRVASCSDDRTVRVYEVSGANAVAGVGASLENGRTGFEAAVSAEQSKSANVGSAMGHLSRIWSVLWLESSPDMSLLMTFGEDTTAQSWQVTHNKAGKDGADGLTAIEIDAGEKYGYHFGKNIWAAATTRLENGEHLICTGGADGMVVKYQVAPLFKQNVDTTLSHVLDPAEFSAQEFEEADDSEASGYESIFRAFEGKWSISRKIISNRLDNLAGELEGEATFSRRAPTDSGFDREMLYEEQGQFTTTTNMTFPARRSYVYRYQRSTNIITAWFVKPDAQTTVDYLFHQVEFGSQSTEGKSKQANSDSRVATGYHLCVKDHYNATYKFGKENGQLQSWQLSYHVTGPKKDYVSTTSFARLAGADSAGQKLASGDKNSKRPSARPDCFRAYCWLCKTECLLTTDHGRILRVGLTRSADGATQSRILQSIGPLRQLRSYSMLCRLGAQAALIADASNRLLVYSAARPEVSCIRQFDTKITFLYAQKAFSADSNDYLVTVQCLKAAEVSWSRLDRSALEGQEQPVFSNVELPQGFTCTSAAFLRRDEVITVGSRNGAIYVQELPGHSIPAELLVSTECLLVPALHGRECVTSITPLTPREFERDDISYFVTTGRDGFLCIHRIFRADGNGALITEATYALRPAFGPNVEGTAFSAETGRLTAWGFSGKEFVAWDMGLDQEIMRISCGNSHRNWSFAPNFDKRGGGSLVWTQANTCHMQLQGKTSHEVLLKGGHGREIKAMATRSSAARSDLAYLATGAEDTDIRLSLVRWNSSGSPSMTRSPTTLRSSTIRKHETGVICLRFKGESLLFSSGGKEEFFVWRMQNNLDLGLIEVKLEGACPQVSEDGDLRIMDFCDVDEATNAFPASGVLNGREDSSTLQIYRIVMVYSDSSIRVWEFDSKPAKFTLLAQGHYTDKCLTCVSALPAAGNAGPRLFLTTSTDGHIAVWSLPHEGMTRQNEPAQVQLVSRHAVHQSSIKCMAVQALEPGQCGRPNRVLVITGGDDNAVALMGLELDCHGEYRSRPRVVLFPRAHAASVNAVEITALQKLRNAEEEPEEAWGSPTSITFATTSSDQTAKLWKANLPSGFWGTQALSMERVVVTRTGLATEVSDPACLTSLRAESIMLFVAGTGIEMIALDTT